MLADSLVARPPRLSSGSRKQKPPESSYDNVSCPATFLASDTFKLTDTNLSYLSLPSPSGSTPLDVMDAPCSSFSDTGDWTAHASANSKPGFPSVTVLPNLHGPMLYMLREIWTLRSTLSRIYRVRSASVGNCHRPSQQLGVRSKTSFV